MKTALNNNSLETTIDNNSLVTTVINHPMIHRRVMSNLTTITVNHVATDINLQNPGDINHLKSTINYHSGTMKTIVNHLRSTNVDIDHC